VNLTLTVTEEQLEEIVARMVDERLAEVDVSAAGGADEWVRGAEAIGAHIGASRWRVYNLNRAGRCWPLQKDGSNLVAKKADLDKWIDEGGGISL